MECGTDSPTLEFADPGSCWRVSEDVADGYFMRPDHPKKRRLVRSGRQEAVRLRKLPALEYLGGPGAVPSPAVYLPYTSPRADNIGVPRAPDNHQW
ncbi:hypothetical protein NDU88_012439 [Pleurodeles waltl]|uniref:Uncharacterized protein n=1 Tax=Pleurodeles waltl TaxID=8319 RepID=A0AAV7R5U4_PLEWA|nr:hypothetical protein NDU88_012439 [Pleurodeles waltl]